MNTLGKSLLGLGLVGAFYFTLVFDVSVATESGGRIVNLGLMSTRQNGMILCGMLAVVGAILTVARQTRPAQIPVAGPKSKALEWAVLVTIATVAVLWLVKTFVIQ